MCKGSSEGTRGEGPRRDGATGAEVLREGTQVIENCELYSLDTSDTTPDVLIDADEQSPRVLYMEFVTHLGTFLVASSQEGVVKLHLPTEPRETFFAWLYKTFGPQNVMQQPPDHSCRASLEGDDAPAFWNKRAAREVREYLLGQRRTFSLEIQLYGTAFRKAVWRKVREIPYGATATYAQIAESIGKPRAVRAVGAANGANPIPIIIPCHRVIGSSGSLVGYGGGIELKRYLLALEVQLLPPH